jgi:hypothetical protein
MDSPYEPLAEQPRGHVGLAVLAFGFVLLSMGSTYGLVLAVTQPLGLFSTVAMVSLCIVSWVLVWLVAETALQRLTGRQ